MPRSSSSPGSPKERVFHAAVGTLATQGYARSTARAVAATGGFAPGVIYYHFADLTDLFVATARFTSSARLARYRELTSGVTSAVQLVELLRGLYAEDEQSGHIAAMQELVAAATAAPALAEAVREETVAWQAYAEEVIHSFVDGTPLADLLPVPQVASAAVATYLGLEMLSHLKAPNTEPERMFDAAAQLAVLLDAMTALS